MSNTETAARGRPGALSRKAWGALLVLCGAIFLDALDVSMVGVALPSIREDLGMSTGALQWVVSAYVLGYGGFLLLGGRAADMLGRRRMFLVSLGVFLVASGIGGLVDDQTLLIASRFIKGVAAAFTAPAGLSIITTHFAEGPERNRALSIYTATGAVGFSLGLVFGGVLTEVDWRLVFFMPVAVAAVALAAGIRFVPHDTPGSRSTGKFDLAGAATITAGMLALVYGLVEAPDRGWLSAATTGTLALATALIGAFVAIEQRTKQPLVRLGILRSGTLVRANIAAMSMFGAWVGFQFIATLYMQQLRGWSPLETGLAIAPGGFMVVLLAPALMPLIGRFGVQKFIVAGLALNALAYLLFLPIGLDSAYVTAILPTMIVAGLGFALAFGPLNIAATSGVAPHEQGLAGGLVNTSFQFGGALVLAIVTAVINANVGTDGTPQALLDGFRPAIVVSLVVALLGTLAVGIRRRPVEVAPVAET